MATLRVAAPEVFEFLYQHYSEFSIANQPDDQRYKEEAKIWLRKSLIETWKQLSDTRRFNPQSAAALLADLYPATACATETRAVQQFNPQSMGAGGRGTIYAQRLFTEEINKSDISDQLILSIIKKTDNDNTALCLLAKEISDSDYASRAFEVFSKVLRFNKHLPLLSEVYAVIRKRHGSIFDRDNHPGFFPSWRSIHDRPVAEIEDWLVTELEKCIPGHLSLLTNIYYYWLGTNHHTFSERELSRKIILGSLAKKWDSMPPEDIAIGFDPASPYTLFHIFFTSDYEEAVSVPLGTIDDWAWSGPILLNACKVNPDIILPHLLIAVNSNQKQSSFELKQYEFSQNNLEVLFHDQVTEFLLLASKGCNLHFDMPEQTKILLRQAFEKAKGIVNKI